MNIVDSFPITLSDIERITREEGERWGYAHARRVLTLGAQIAGDLAYDRASFAYAVYLHDWGAYPRWRQPGVDHALRSRQVAEEEVLPYTSLRAVQVNEVLEAIERHDFRDLQPIASNVALLLREADWLDMLGAIGIARELAWGPNHLPSVIERIELRRRLIPGRFTLPEARAIAALRVAEMDHWLNQIHLESYGYL